MSVPASAEFFGCNDKRGKVLAVYGGRCYTHEFRRANRAPAHHHPSAPHHPGRNAKRHCRSWLAKEYRVSGPVVVPQMRC